MKLIVIYGPPAAGKLTVAKELSKITKFKILHNHSTIDLVASIIKFGTDDFWDLNRKLRLGLFEAAAKEKQKGLIFTFCYAHKHDDHLVRKIKRVVEKHKGKVCFVQLYCHRTELEKRVKAESRKGYRKIKTIRKLRESLSTHEMFKPIPFVKSLSIDNAKVSPKKAAKLIKQHYRL